MSSAEAFDNKSQQTIAITATFTAELLEAPLQFWMEELGMPCRIEFAPFDQVFQQLLDPTSLLSSNKSGLNVVLIRVEDWWRGASELKSAEEERAATQQRVQKNAQDLLAALKAASEHAAVPCLVCLCPASQQLQAEAGTAEVLQQLEARMAEILKDYAGVYVLTAGEIAALYPVANYEDRRADEVGHVPYTQEYFNALGTMMARRFFRLNTPPQKVIALDCDQTLWRGVCGEDGARGVKVDSAFRALQEFVIAQRNAGMVICLCSKNNEEDVWKVFEQNSGMVLRREHVLASRINWQAKSENLRSLAAELQLGLDSFIFLDDSGLECAEVGARCPEITTLQLPEEASEISKFLSQVWAFDHLKITEEDRLRNEQYAQNTGREQLRKQSLSLEDFLAGLELQLEISPMAKSDLARVSQITQRTNQFNFTTVRLSEMEIEKLCQSGTGCLVVRLRDRFGDYGLVGAMLYSKHAGHLDVENVLLSCRALGRRVEHRMLARIGEIAQEQGLQQVRIKFVPTQKNKPAREFLDAIGAVLQPENNGFVCEFAAQALIDLPSTAPVAGGEPENEVATASAAPVADAKSRPPGQSRSKLFGRIARQLNDAARISSAIAAKRPVRSRRDSEYVAPETELQQSLARLWSQYLAVDKIGAHDNFFELGGQSLSAMQIAFKIQETFNVDFPLEKFLQTPVLADQAGRVEAALIQQADAGDLEQLLNEIEQVRE